MRYSEISRETKETIIKSYLEIYPRYTAGSFSGTTGIGFFDHMLSAFAVHGGFNLKLEAKGDLDVDCHHTVEDCGIVIGKLFSEALKEKTGIKRFGSAFVPMDEALASAYADISGRPYLVFNAEFKNQSVGTFDCAMTEEFFRAFAFNAGITLHISVMYGSNDHHKIEAVFKAAARAVSEAAETREGGILSSKGTI